MINTIQLQDLYNKVFGVVVPKYTLDEKLENTRVGEDGKLDTEYTGKYGTKMYATNAITGGYYFLPAFFDLDEDGVFTKKDYEIPFPIIRIQSQKRIIETPLTERKGTVVELINQESWKIYIKGFIIGKKGAYPEEDIAKMIEVYERNTSLRLRCVLTDLFLTADDRVCIKSLNFPEVKGIEDVKPYELELVSVNIFDLTDLTPLG